MKVRLCPTSYCTWPDKIRFNFFVYFLFQLFATAVFGLAFSTLLLSAVGKVRTGLQHEFSFYFEPFVTRRTPAEQKETLLHQKHLRVEN